MHLNELFVFPWRQDGYLVAAVTGFVKYEPSGRKYLDIDHMIVSPRAHRKFAVMMEMSEHAAQAAFLAGCAYILLSIFQNNPRRSGLQAWARRLEFEPYASSDDADWYIRRRPARKDSSDGQGCQAPRSAAAPRSA